MADGVFNRGPCFRAGGDEVEMACGGDFGVANVLPLGFLLLGVLAAEIRGDDVISGAVNQPLGGRMVDGELHGIGLVTMVGHLAGLASEKSYDCVVAEMLLPRFL